ncbi:carbohydrate-binding module family 1 protein [Athelia psychrophila]|uniref:Carboxylic ester hydrolase n=1 Tax=Athelia psychrophila TaxID=1759441 RepID=A0A166E7D0_9AGAM|nr:carbohydrate-binding module family 1 protein [Fibularhizoctonia sp. CBS 109695]
MFAFKCFLGLLVAVTSACALSSTLQQVTNFGTNPNNVGMYVYKPSKLAIPTPLIIGRRLTSERILGMHQCTGTAQGYFQSTALASLADTHGFIVVYPNSPRSGTCWDVASPQTLSHNGGGDSIAMASIAKYAIANWGVDSTRVFATGTSSGAMMTSVLMGAYPDIFAAGSLYSGVAFGCFAGPSAWNNACAQGQMIETAAYWGNLVRAAYPGYTGTRPRVQFWHGTADTTLYPQNFQEEIKQWSNVFGVSATPVTTTTNDPHPGYSRESFAGGYFQGILAQGVGHTVPEQETDTLNWFGLSSLVPGNGNGGTTSSTSSTSTSSTSGTQTTTSTSSSPASSPTGGTVPEYGQCGGITYTGPTTCAAGFTCKAANAYQVGRSCKCIGEDRLNVEDRS